MEIAEEAGVGIGCLIGPRERGALGYVKVGGHCQIFKSEADRSARFGYDDVLGKAEYNLVRKLLTMCPGLAVNAYFRPITSISPGTPIGQTAV